MLNIKTYFVGPMLKLNIWCWFYRQFHLIDAILSTQSNSCQQQTFD